MDKFEYDDEDDYFNIDPKFLSKGLDVAAKKKYSSIRITALDFRDKNLEFNMEDLANCSWIRRLILDEYLNIGKEDAKKLERLTNLKELTVKEYDQLDYSKFKKLKDLVISDGTTLSGLDKIPSLNYFYLSRWKKENLPDNIKSISATEIRISASRKLTSIEPLFSIPHLTKLMLQDLPKISVGKNINKLKALKELHVEKCGWTDFSELKSKSLEDLFISKTQSLSFIKQLKNLRKLFFWDCVDGNMQPIMKHPALKEIYFTPQKKHYSHKEKYLQEYIQGKHSS